MIPNQDFSTIDIYYIPAIICNATSIPHEHFFKRITIDEDVKNLIDNKIIDIYNQK